MKQFSFLSLFNLIGVLILGCVMLSGCGKRVPDGFPKTYPASLTILHSGAPFDAAKVFLRPVEGAAMWSVGGDADDNGVFRFTTIQGSHSVMGIPAGEYIVTISHFKLVNVLPSNFDELSDAERTQALVVQEKAEMEAQKSSKVPQRLGNPETSPIRWTINASDSNELTIKLDDY